MNSNTITNGILKAIAILAGIAVLFIFLYKIRSVLGYIAIAGVISLIGRPIVLFLRRKLKFKKTLAAIITIVFIILIIVGIISLLVPLLVKQGHNLSLLDIEALQANVKSLYNEVLDYFSLKGIHLEQSLKNSDVVSWLDFKAIPNFLNSLVGFIGNFGIGLFSVIFIAFFFLKDSRLFEESIMTLVPDEKEIRLKKSIIKIKDLLSRYFLGLLFQILILFIFYTIILLVFNIENAVVIAFLCALLNLIPYVGPLVGGFLMLLLTMSSNLGEDFSSVILPKTLYVMIGFIVGQLIDNFISQPFIFSNSVKSHPLEIFLIIIIGGLLFGVLGMVVAVPFYTSIKVILKEFLAENKIVKSLTKNL